VVNVRESSALRHESAVLSYVAALAVSPLRRAMSPAQTRPATSAATVDGDRPLCSSQRSPGVAGPKLTMWSAVSLIFCQVAASVSPVCQASTMGKASSSSCSQQPSCCGDAPPTPLTGE
jgi:hypothetical protein